MHDLTAVIMEIQAFLPNGCRGKDERPEGRVESLSHTIHASDRVIADLGIVIADRIVAAHRGFLLCRE